MQLSFMVGCFRIEQCMCVQCHRFEDQVSDLTVLLIFVFDLS